MSNSIKEQMKEEAIALTHGAMCVFCELSDYRCKHAMSIDDKVKAVKKLMEENSNAEN